MYIYVYKILVGFVATFHVHYFLWCQQNPKQQNLQNSHHPKVIWSHGKILLHCCKWSSPRALGLETLAFLKDTGPI